MVLAEATPEQIGVFFLVLAGIVGFLAACGAFAVSCTKLYRFLRPPPTPEGTPATRAEVKAVTDPISKDFENRQDAVDRELEDLRGEVKDVRKRQHKLSSSLHRLGLMIAAKEVAILRVVGDRMDKIAENVQNLVGKVEHVAGVIDEMRVKK